MIHTLFVCYGVFLGICGQIQQVEYPTLEACERERTFLMAAPTKPYYAICKPGRATPR